jgi:hypothetical protein
MPIRDDSVSFFESIADKANLNDLFSRIAAAINSYAIDNIVCSVLRHPLGTFSRVSLGSLPSHLLLTQSGHWEKSVRHRFDSPTFSNSFGQ